MLYHNLCWATVKKKAEAPQKTVYNSKEIIHTVSEIELINLIESELNDPSHQILDMNKVTITYRHLLFENGLNIMKFVKTNKNNLKHSFKKIYHAPNLLKVKVLTSQKKFLQKKHNEKQYINHQ